MRYNLGCGSDYRHGWINVDKDPEARPDLVMDLEVFPWPIHDDDADEILLSYVLEHLGGRPETFLNVVKELYRICKPGARIVIRTPDPRHDDYMSDPAHQRPITPGLLRAFDLALNELSQAAGQPGPRLAKSLKIDFTVASATPYLDPRWQAAIDGGRINAEVLGEAMRAQNNVIQRHEIALEARKPFSPGRSLVGLDSVVAARGAGMGDVLMAIAALCAVKRATGTPVYLATTPNYAELAALCPLLDGVFTDIEAVNAHMSRSNSRLADWRSSIHGTTRHHQIDSYLQAFGLTLPAELKALEIALPPGLEEALLARIGLDAAADGPRRAILHPGITDPNRTWPPAFWTALVEHLLVSGFQVILIGRRDSPDGRSALQIDRPDVLDLTDQLSLPETLALMRRCDVLVSGDSGPIQLAGAAKIGIVGLYSVVSGGARLPYRVGARRAVAIEPPCAFHPCYPWVDDADTRIAFAAKEGLPITSGLLLERWCLNPDTHACVRDPSTLERVKAAIDEMLDEPAAAQSFSRSDGTGASAFGP